VHAVGGQVESQSAGLRVQLDDDALLVLEIRDRKLPRRDLTLYAGLARAMPIARPLTIKAPISGAAAAARAP
jgi:hypothetical protein